MNTVHGFPKKPRKRKNKSGSWGYFPFFANYSGATVGSGNNDVAMAQGVEGGDGGGMGEAPEVNMPPAVIGNEDKFSKSKDEDDSGTFSAKPEETTSDAPTDDQPKKVERSHEFGVLMLPVTPAVDAILNYWMRRNIPTASLHFDDNKDGFESELHCTLKYGLPTTTPENVSEILDGCGPVTLLFGKVAKFEKDGFDCIHVEVDGNYLRQLNTLVSDSIQCTDTFKEYRPHVTLAWVKKGSCDHLLGNDFFSMLSDTIDEVLFVNTDGEEYFISLGLE